MFFEQRTYQRVASPVLLLATIFLSCTSATISADEIRLSVAPDKCISLRKGQTCYQRVLFRWQTSNDTPVCLWRDGDDNALQCWNGKQSGQFRYRFRANKTVGFSLATSAEPEQAIARTQVKINWVYKNRSSGRSRWRLF